MVQQNARVALVSETAAACEVSQDGAGEREQQKCDIDVPASPECPIAVGDLQVTFKANCDARIGRPSDKPTADGERHYLSSPRMTKMKPVLILIHMLYSYECCEDHHCRPVPCNEVIDLGDDGWRWRDRTFPKWTLRASPDGNCHVCVANIPVCIYLPPRV